MKKVIFIHINKCGGTSIKKTIGNLPNIIIPKNDDLIHYCKTSEWKNSIKITIIRNPYDRILSLYGMLLRDGKNYNLNDVIRIITNDNIKYKNNSGGLPTGDEYVKRHGLKLTHPHYCVYNDDILMDYVFKLENIKNDWIKIKQITKCENELKHVNQSFNQKKYDIFTKKQIEKINDYFHDDFNIFGYDKIF